MKSRNGMQQLVALGALMAGAIVSAVERAPGLSADPNFFPKRGKGQNNRRGKGKRSPPKKRSNRLTISKRVRRKHRRAA